MEVVKSIAILIFAASLLGLQSCSSNSSDRVSYHLIKPDLDLGEYLQISGANRIVTASRKGDQKGILQIDSKTEVTTVIDADAAEARDLMLIEGYLLFRIGKDIFLSDGSRRLLTSDAKKLQAFQWNQNEGVLFYEDIQGQERWKIFNSDGAILSSGTHQGAARASFKINESSWFLFQTEKGLTLTNFDHGEIKRQISVTDDPYSGNYVRARVIGKTLWIAHMNEDNGCLYISQMAAGDLSQPTPSIKTDLVDGEPHKVYRGLDIAIAAIRDQPVLYYLDGWALRLREAVLSKGSWISREIPIQGSLGFYTQILDESSSSLTLATHNFRTSLDGTHQSFEDLMLLTLEPRVDN